MKATNIIKNKLTEPCHKHWDCIKRKKKSQKPKLTLLNSFLSTFCHFPCHLTLHTLNGKCRWHFSLEQNVWKMRYSNTHDKSPHNPSHPSTLHNQRQTCSVFALSQLSSFNRFRIQLRHSNNSESSTTKSHFPSPPPPPHFTAYMHAL